MCAVDSYLFPNATTYLSAYHLNLECRNNNIKGGKAPFTY